MSISPKNIILNSIFGFTFQLFVWIVLLILCEKKVIERIGNKILAFLKGGTLRNMNNRFNNIYVKNEKDKIANENEDLSFKISNLTKIYRRLCGPNNTAVNDLYIGLKPNEKFGLLGFNGSGKTTTFKTITNEIFYDDGEINLFKLDVQKDFGKIRKQMGYCPQSNALFEYLTVEETFNFYKNIKKTNSINSKLTTEELMEKFGMIKFRKTLSVHLSGGNKRKLNFAIALINNPRIILLDEPSTGVDPESRRIMWKNINEIPMNLRMFNMLLSTHSMEEAEILCDKIGWMKNGNFVCIGNPEKLKLEFSEGYYLHIKIKKPTQDSLIIEIDEEHIFEKLSKQSDLIINFKKENVLDLIRTSKASYAHVYIFYYDKLFEIVEKIKPFAKFVKISSEENVFNGVFEIIINVLPEKQKFLFKNLLKLKVKVLIYILIYDI